MAVASRLAVKRVSPDGARPTAVAGRVGVGSAVRLPPAVGRGRRRGRDRAVAATHPTEEALQMTEIHCHRRSICCP
jgi:glutamate--cysteine ligase